MTSNPGSEGLVQDEMRAAEGIHFVQETHPERIGTELSMWYTALGERTQQINKQPEGDSR